MSFRSSGWWAELLLIVLLAVIAAMAIGPALGAGQAVGIKHPVLDHRIDAGSAAGYEKAVERVMSMSEEEMLSFVPEKPFVYFCECPNCYGGAEGLGVFKWSVDRRDELVCKFCGTVYPNEKLPEDQILEGKNALGETSTYKYHHEKTKNVRCFLSGHTLVYKRGWILNQCMALGKAYQATGDEKYARRAALILDRIGQVYPHYPVVEQWIRRFRFPKSQVAPYPGAGGKWGRWASGEIPRTAAACYDLVYDSEEFDKLSEERGYDVREKLENDFFKATFDYINTFPRWAGNTAPRVTRGAIMIGRVINEPRYVHWAYKVNNDLLNSGCMFDGVWHESPSYHYMTLVGLKSAFSAMKGYSDPPGYVDEVDGTRFDNLDPENDIAFFGKALHAPEVVDFPNGCSSPFHDSWAGEVRSPARSETVSTILPALGHASLGRGQGNDQMQAQLHFSGDYGHQHQDSLNLTLFAKGSEMLSDMGYTWTQMRYWTCCTPGHNTVVVDRKDQRGRPADGDLLWFFPDSRGISVVEADGKRAYSSIEGLDMYRRMLAMIPVSVTDAYVVDVFRTRGGSVHDWVAHGDASNDMTATCSLALGQMRENLMEPGEEWKDPEVEGSRFPAYGMMREMAGGETAETFTITFNYADEAQKGVRTHIVGDGTTQVWLGKSPSVRRAGIGSKGDAKKVYDYWMPQLVVRRRAEAEGLQTAFVAVEEPFLGKPFIRSVERVQLSPPDDNAVALCVLHGDVVDTIISTLDEAPYPERTTTDGIRMKGRLGIVRQRQGKTLGVWLFEGEEMVVGGWGIAASRTNYSGQIQAATRKTDGAASDAFIASAGLPGAAELPQGEVLRGVWMIVTHGNGHTHGYEIDRVEKRDGKTAIVLTDDHGLRIEGNKTREVYFPQREIEGPNTFLIPLAATVLRGG